MKFLHNVKGDKGDAGSVGPCGRPGYNGRRGADGKEGPPGDPGPLVRHVNNYKFIFKKKIDSCTVVLYILMISEDHVILKT